MNWLESIYCYSQNEGIKQGESINYDSQNGNLILTFCLLMWIFGALYLIITIPTIADFISTSGRFKLIGEIFVAISIALVYPIIAKTIGKQSNFERITKSYFKMSAEEQTKIARKGAAFYSLSLLYLPIILFVKWRFG